MRQPAYPGSLFCTAVMLAVATAALAGCGSPEDEPVAGLAVEPARMEVPYGTFTDLRLRWTPRSALAGLEGSPRVFLHLLDPEGDLVRTFDHDLRGSWQPGQDLDSEVRVYQSLLGPPLPPGTYTLTAGLYDSTGDARWMLEAAGEDVGRREYEVATVEVPSRTGGDAGVPAVQFTSSWSPTFAGGDRQVIAFRWLAGEGSIRLQEVLGPGTLWLSLGIPPEDAEAVRRWLPAPDEGSDGVARVDVVATCSGFESQVSGEGSHGLDVPVEPSEAGCEITLSPNFVLESPEGERRSVILTLLAWRSAAG